jgi:DNA-binding GntR family transcriptional regulator
MGVELSIPVDRNSPVPLYFQIAQRLEQMIESGELPVGTQLDNEIALADQLGLSRPTMRRAIEFLVDRGLLVRKRGVGTRVVHSKVRRPVELTSLHDDLTKAGRHPRTTVLSLRLEPASTAVAYALGIPEGTEVYSIERLRFADKDPLALMRNHVPADLVTLGSADLEERGLYEILRARGITMRIASQTIGARAATPAEARTLFEPPGAPLLTMTRTSYDDHGRAVEHGDHLYRASLYSFELTLASS